MSEQVLIFLGSLALAILSSVVLGHDLDRIGHRLHFSEGLTGLLTALGADAPEISAAVVALAQHRHEVGLGVVLGSNIFNLAGLLGLSAIVAGRVRIGRQGLLLDGAVAIAVTIVAAGLTFGLLSPGIACALLAALFVPYVLVFTLRPQQVARLPMPRAAHRFLDAAVIHIQQDARKDQMAPRASWMEFASVIPAIASIILGSYGMVLAAGNLGRRWGVADAVIGTLILAGLTSLPNVVMAVRLALHGRGAAVVSEALNSNTINIIAGFCIPALFYPEIATPSAAAVLTVWWLLAMTVLAISIAYVRGGLRWRGGLALVLMYAAFATIVARLR